MSWFQFVQSVLHYVFGPIALIKETVANAPTGALARFAAWFADAVILSFLLPLAAGVIALRTGYFKKDPDAVPAKAPNLYPWRHAGVQYLVPRTMPTGQFSLELPSPDPESGPPP